MVAWAGCLAALLAGCLVGCATPLASAEHKSFNAYEAAVMPAAASTTTGDEPLLEGALSLDEAVELALANNKELLRIEQERRAARGAVLESYGAILPNLTAGAGYRRLDEAPRMEFGGQSEPIGVEDNYAVDLLLRQPLFEGRTIPATLRRARYQARLTEESIRAAVQAVIFETTRGYYNLLLAKELVGVNEQAARFAEMLLADIQRKQKQGLVSDYDVLRAEVEVSNAQADLIRQRNGRNLAATRLLKQMGVSRQSQVTLSDPLAYQAESADLETELETARLNRPELQQAEWAVRAQNESALIARSAAAPKVEAYAGQQWANPDPHSAVQEEWGDAWSAGLLATFPIFDGFVRRGQRLQAETRLEQAQIQKRDQAETIALDVQQAVMSLQDAEALVKSQQLNLERAGEGLRLIQSGYRQGLRTEVEVMDAQTALTRTRALFYQALHDHLNARLNLKRATGTLKTPEAAGAEPPHD